MREGEKNVQVGVATVGVTGRALLPVLVEKGEALLKHLGEGEPMAKAIKLAGLRMGQFHEIYENQEWALRIDKACTAFKRIAGAMVLQEATQRFVEGDTEEVLTKGGELVKRKVKVDANLVKVLLSGLDPQFANTPAGASGMGGGTHIHITNNLPAATVANIAMGNEDVVRSMMEGSLGAAKRVVEAEVIEPKEEKGDAEQVSEHAPAEG